MDGSAHVPQAEPGKELQQYYVKLLQELGPQRWWPARTRLEVILGAILTQNTAWRNAALALTSLRRAGLTNLARLRKASRAELETCVRPAGFFRQKARTIRNFLDWLAVAHRGSLNSFFTTPPAELRRHLLELKGVGPETADAILLYAGQQPFFVADAYTRRILARHKFVSPIGDYSEAQEFLHQHLTPDPALFNEYHALLVEVGKRYCKRQAPQCAGCPLEPFLPGNGNHTPGVKLHARPGVQASAAGPAMVTHGDHLHTPSAEGRQRKGKPSRPTPGSSGDAGGNREALLHRVEGEPRLESVNA